MHARRHLIAIAIVMIGLVLLAGCGTAEPTAAPELPADTPAPSATATSPSPTVAPLPSPTFTPVPPTVVPSATTTPLPLLSLESSSQSFGRTETFQVGLGDLDGDGDLDAVLANMGANDSQVWLNDGTGRFVDSGQELTQQGHGLGLGDLDADGDLDIFMTCAHYGGSGGGWRTKPSRVYLNDGRGRFQDSGQDLGDTELSGNGVNLVDVDGDGDLDAHVVYYEVGGMADKVYLNDGRGRFTDSGLALSEETVAWGDLDADGDVDIFAKAHGEGYRVLLNDGAGQFTTGWQVADSEAMYGGIALGDFDGDGDLDALVASGFRTEGSFPTRLLWNDGAARFTDSGQVLNETLAAEFALGDLDLDGDLDVFVSNMDLPGEAWLNDGGGLVDSGLRLQSPSRHWATRPSLGDLDLDGDLDVVVAGFRGTAEVWSNHTPSGSPPGMALYLGQTPPGLDVELFAPGIVSIENGKEYKIALSPDLQEIFFIRRTPGGNDDRLWYSRLENGKLTMPELAPFAYDCFEADPCYTPDGNRLYFNSWRPLPGEEALSDRPNVWFVDRTGEGWSQPQFLGPPLNDYRPVYFSIANDGTIYFTRSSPREIWYAERQGGQYAEAKRLPDEINDLRDVAHPAIAPDESYLIVDSYHEEGDRLVGSLYISFRRPDGSWTRAVSMREALGATESDVYANARVSPDGAYIFFERYEKETDKADIHWVSARVVEALRPPAGGLIAFVSDRDGNGEIYVMNADGSDVRRLTNWRQWDGYPAWSPDGRQIAYYSYLKAKDWVIKVMDADGGNPRQLTDNGTCDGAPYWSPDGTRIAYNSDADCTAEHREIYVMNADGSGQINLTQNDADDMGSSWSPDSQQIVFSSDRDGDYEIYIMSAGGDNVRQLTENDAQDLMAAWSPGGKQIAFVSDREGNDEIYVMDVRGDNVRRLTENAVVDWFPFWSPDGSQIVFNSRRDGNLEVYVMDADGGNVRRLTNSPGDDFNAVWQPLPAAPGGPSTWIKTYEGDPVSAAFDAVPAGDGGYLLVGATNYTHRDAADEDVHLMKIDAAGQMLWEKTYGGDRYDRGKAILPAAGGGFVLLAETESFGAGGRDIYLLQVDEDGDEIWSYTFGGPGKERANAILQTADGGFILAGQTSSSGAGGADLYLVETDDQGGEVWSRTYGGEHDEEGYDVRGTSDGGFLVLAQVVQGEAVYVDQKPDILLLKTDGSGEERWSQLWATEEADGGHVLLPSADGTYLIAGITAPAGNQQQIDVLTVKVDAGGNPIWHKLLGDPNAVDYGTDAMELPGGGYLLTGLFNRSGRGAIPLIRTDASGEVVWTRTLLEGRGNKVGMRLLPTPDGGYLIVGTTDQYGRGFETILIKTDGEGNVEE